MQTPPSFLSSSPPNGDSGSVGGNGNRASSSSMRKERDSMNRSQRCGVCRGCQAKACGRCVYCQDSPQFGGPGVKKQSCIERRCHRVLENRLQRDGPSFKAKSGCGICDECSSPDCHICLVCLDRRFFDSRYLPGAMCAKKRCNQARSIEIQFVPSLSAGASTYNIDGTGVYGVVGQRQQILPILDGGPHQCGNGITNGGLIGHSGNASTISPDSLFAPVFHHADLPFMTGPRQKRSASPLNGRVGVNVAKMIRTDRQRSNQPGDHPNVMLPLRLFPNGGVTQLPIQQYPSGISQTQSGSVMNNNQAIIHSPQKFVNGGYPTSLYATTVPSSSSTALLEGLSQHQQALILHHQSHLGHSTDGGNYPNIGAGLLIPVTAANIYGNASADSMHHFQNHQVGATIHQIPSDPSDQFVAPSFAGTHVVLQSL